MSPVQVLSAHQDDRVVENLFGLNKGEGLKKLVGRANAPWQSYEAVGILEEQHLAHKKVMACHGPIDIAIDGLFRGQHDIASDRPGANVLCPPIGRLHQPRSATGHDRKPEPTQSLANLARHVVIRMSLGHPC